MKGFSSSTSGKGPACQSRRHKRHGFNTWVGKIPCRRAWQPTPVFLPGESHGQKILVGYSPLGHKELDTTEMTQHARTRQYLLLTIFISHSDLMSQGTLLFQGTITFTCHPHPCELTEIRSSASLISPEAPTISAFVTNFKHRDADLKVEGHHKSQDVRANWKLSGDLIQ